MNSAKAEQQLGKEKGKKNQEEQRTIKIQVDFSKTFFPRSESSMSNIM